MQFLKNYCVYLYQLSLSGFSGNPFKLSISPGREHALAYSLSWQLFIRFPAGHCQAFQRPETGLYLRDSKGLFSIKPVVLLKEQIIQSKQVNIFGWCCLRQTVPRTSAKPLFYFLPCHPLGVSGWFVYRGPQCLHNDKSSSLNDTWLCVSSVRMASITIWYPDLCSEG